MPRLIVVRNAFEPYRREVNSATIGSRIIDYLPKEIPFKNWQFIHGGRTLSAEEAEAFRFSRDDEEIIARVIPGVTAAFLAGGSVAVGALSLAAQIGYTALALVINLAISAAITFGVNALINAFTKQPKKATTGDESATYSWEGVQNTIRNGTPIPVIYGHHKFGGHFLSTFTKPLQDGSNSLYMLLGLGAGPVEGINGVFIDSNSLTGSSIGTGLRINNSVATQFYNLEVSYRLGAWGQTIAPGFDDVIYEISVGQDITLSPYLYTTADEVQSAELLFQFPSGLYSWTKEGAFLTGQVQVKYRYRQDDDAATWSGYTTVTFSSQTRSTYNTQIRIDFPVLSKYRIEVTRVSALDEQYSMTAFMLRGVNEVLYNDISYPGIALVGIKSAATEQLNGQLPVVTNEVYGKRVRVYRPGDDFSEDSEYTYTQDGGAPYGWHAENVAKAASAQIHTYATNTFSVLHGSTATDWDDATTTGPFFFKKIVTDSVDYSYDVRVKVTLGGSPGAYDSAGICIRNPEVAGAYHIFALRYTDPGYVILKRSTVDGVSTDGSYDSTTLDNGVYLRVVCTALTNVQFYYSMDGTTWVDCGPRLVGWPQLYYTHEVGLVTWSTAGTNTFRANFEEFTFATNTEYCVQCSNNPAWVIYDLLTDEHYGVGAYVDTDQIDLDTFISFAAYCDTQVANPRGGMHRRHRFDGIIDTAGAAWEQIQTIAELYRAVVLRQGDKIHITWNTDKVATQLFNVSNVVRSSFTETIHAPELNANFWEVQYLNEGNDWEQDYTSYVDPDIEAGEPFRREATASWGITREQEALRRARYLCKCNRHLTKAVSFESGIDAIACEPGDRIEIQHDLVQWGNGGRVVSATANSITFDKDVTIVSGVTYQVRVKHLSTDTIETVLVTSNTPGQYWAVNTAAWAVTPTADDLYSFGQQTILTKPFIVVNIERSNELNCKIDAIEYNEDIYDDSIESVENLIYTELPDPRKIPDDITNLTLTERAQVMNDRTIQHVIDVTYTLPYGAPKADIYYREHDKVAWIYSGRERGQFYTIVAGFVYGTTYDVAVAAVSPWGLHKNPEDCPYLSITILGRATRPDPPTNLRITVVGEHIHLRWTGVDTADLEGYEIRYGPSDWETATPLGVTPNTEYITPNFAGGQTLWFQVRSYNTSGLYSATSLSVQQTLPIRSNENILIERDEALTSTDGWSGTKHNMIIDGNYLKINPVSTDPTHGTYTTEIIDCGAPVRPLVSVLHEITQSDNTLTWAAATFSWASDQAVGTTWAGTAGESHVVKELTFRYGNDPGALGDYETFIVGEYAGRYFQFSIDLQTDSETYGAVIEKFIIKLDVPDRICSAKEVELIEGASTTITFTTIVPGFPGFSVAPDFVCIPTHNMSHTSTLPSVGDWVQVLGVTKDDVELRYYESDGTPKPGKISFIARGY